MKDPENNDLISQIKEVLHEYEEPYMDGAWEQFSSKQERRVIPFWRWMAAAAVFVLVGSIWLLSSKQPLDKVQVIVAKRETLPLPSAKAPEAIGTPALGQVAITKKPLNNLKHFNSEQQAGIMNSATLTTPMIAENNIKEVDVLPDGRMRVAEVEFTARRATGANRDKFMNFLVDQAKIHGQKHEADAKKEVKTASNWRFGMEILPTLSEAALNVGAGLSTQYKLSEHFSVGSGISYVALQASKNLTPGVSLLSARQLQSVDANFRGIDIPLNLVYNINKNLYTAVGVSYFNIIKEDRKNTFVSEQQVSSASSDPVTGLAASTRTFVSQTIQEPATETLLNGKSYLGFFNFSIGRKQELFKKYNIFIEPFIKVPVGKLSQQEMKMMNGGMKFRLAF
jgi:hypothetical protein